jgi:myosin heavy subunit
VIIPQYTEDDSEDDERALPKKVNDSNILPRDLGANSKIVNLLGLEQLNEGNILHVLCQRYEMSVEDHDKYKVYAQCTFCGNILLYINPSAEYEGDFDERRKRVYLKRLKESYYEMTNMPPHLYATVMAAVHPLIYSKKKSSRSIVYFGESGSGKTECIKYSLDFITCCFSDAGMRLAPGEPDKTVPGIDIEVNFEKPF